VANEVVDKVQKLKKESLLFKVYFEKVYDSVDCKYLDVIIGKMNFLVLWRKWIMKCHYNYDLGSDEWLPD